VSQLLKYAILLLVVVTLLGLAACATHTKATLDTVRVTAWNLDRRSNDALKCDVPSDEDFAALRKYAGELRGDLIFIEAKLAETDLPKIFPARGYDLQIVQSSASSCLDEGVSFPLLLGLARRTNAKKKLDVARVYGGLNGFEGIDISVRSKRSAPLHILFTALPEGCEVGVSNSSCTDYFKKANLIALWAEARVAKREDFELVGAINRTLNVFEPEKNPIEYDRLWGKFTPLVSIISPGVYGACLDRNATQNQALIGKTVEFVSLKSVHWQDQALTESCAFEVTSVLPGQLHQLGLSARN